MRTGWYIALGVVLMVATMFLTAQWDRALLVGSVFALGALNRLHMLANRRAIAETNKPVEDAYRAGYDYGYDEGWHAGRQASRPTVVRFGHRAAERVPEYHTGEIR